MKRTPCRWCVRVACSCGWRGYRPKSTLNDPRPCPHCWGWPLGNKPRTREVQHHMSTVCPSMPAAELAKLKNQENKIV
jgi:hypothetical protein